jgi:hypothetical protein
MFFAAVDPGITPNASFHHHCHRGHHRCRDAAGRQAEPIVTPCFRWRGDPPLDRTRGSHPRGYQRLHPLVADRLPAWVLAHAR